MKADIQRFTVLALVGVLAVFCSATATCACCRSSPIRWR
jgi:hypothetical protein